MRGHTWNKQEEVKLVELVKQGLTYLQISKILNKSKNSVLGKANRLQLPYLAVKVKKEKKSTKPVLDYKPYVPLVLEDAPKSLQLTINDLEKNNCRYIAGNDRLFCGHKTIEGSSYCEYHKNVCCMPNPLLT